MKVTIIYVLIGLVLLFAGIKIGAKTALKKQINEFEILRHQNLATEIDLQIRLLKLVSDGKPTEAQRTLVKWLEQNVCEMGAYKKSKFFISDTEVTESLLKAKKYVEENKLMIGECSKNTFVEYSGLHK